MGWFRRAVPLAVASFFFAAAGLCGQTPKARRVVHVFVALADNQHQGIVPVPAVLGNGDDPARNLYWGAAFGVRTFFKNSPDWKEAWHVEMPDRVVLERSEFVHRGGDVLLVADAYRGREIKQSLIDFFDAAGGMATATESQMPFPLIIQPTSAFLSVPTNADLVAYVGHDGLMDFRLRVDYAGHSGGEKPAIVLACASKPFFRENLRTAGATPLLWTTGLMAPEAYTLKAALDGWILGEGKEQIRKRAAAAYAKYQKCGDTAALRLFSTDW